MRKTGILGGTFDPVHNGHLAIAEKALIVCKLDNVLFVPAAVPPHKQERDVTDFSKRAAMVDLAIRHRPGFHLSTIEAQLPVPSFSIDTLRYLKNNAGPLVTFYFITGEDAFLDIASWKDYRSLLRACDFIIFSRTGTGDGSLIGFVESLGYRQVEKSCWHHPESGCSIHHINTIIPDVSSTDVRNFLKEGRDVTHLIPDSVASYIRDEGLYV